MRVEQPGIFKYTSKNYIKILYLERSVQGRILDSAGSG